MDTDALAVGRNLWWLDSPRVARSVLVVGMLVGCGVWVWLGCKRWFVADDWAFLLYRDPWETHGSVGAALFTSHNGHPVVLTALQFSVTSRLFGWSSCLPFMAAPLVLHVVCGWLLWLVMLRVGVSEIVAAAVTVVVV